MTPDRAVESAPAHLVDCIEAKVGAVVNTEPLVDYQKQVQARYRPGEGFLVSAYEPAGSLPPGWTHMDVGRSQTLSCPTGEAVPARSARRSPSRSRPAPLAAPSANDGPSRRSRTKGPTTGARTAAAPGAFGGYRRRHGRLRYQSDPALVQPSMGAEPGVSTRFGRLAGVALHFPLRPRRRRYRQLPDHACRLRWTARGVSRKSVERDEHGRRTIRSRCRPRRMTSWRYTTPDRVRRKSLSVAWIPGQRSVDPFRCSDTAGTRVSQDSSDRPTPQSAGDWPEMEVRVQPG